MPTHLHTASCAQPLSIRHDNCLPMPPQRRHYIMALNRTAYLKRGANYTESATLLRCVRPDQSSATVRCHYLADGGVNFAFTMRRAEYFLPAGLLLRCFLEVRKDRRVAGMCRRAWGTSVHPPCGAPCQWSRTVPYPLRRATRCLRECGPTMHGLTGCTRHRYITNLGLLSNFWCALLVSACLSGHFLALLETCVLVQSHMRG